MFDIQKVHNFIKENFVKKCYEFTGCVQCEWFGVCPHSYYYDEHFDKQFEMLLKNENIKRKWEAFNNEK